MQTKETQWYDVPFQAWRGMNQHVQLLLAALSLLSPQFVVLPHLLQPVLIFTLVCSSLVI